MTAMIDTTDLTRFHRDKHHKATTRSLVRGALRHWERLGLVEPCSGSLAEYRDRRLKEGAAADTVRGELTKLISIANWLGIEVAVKKPRAVQRIPRAWTRKQIRELFAAAKSTKRTIWGMPANVFFPALLGVCHDTGERIGAIASVRWESIDLDGRQIFYAAEIRKGGYRDAQASLSRPTIRALRALRELTPDSGVIFCHGSMSRLWQAYTALLKDAGLPYDRRSKFHRLRRTHATFVHIAGGDAVASLGHASPETTWRHYIDPTQIAKKLPWRPWW